MNEIMQLFFLCEYVSYIFSPGSEMQCCQVLFSCGWLVVTGGLVESTGH